MRDLTNTPYKQFIWFIAEIVETNTDPNKLGRVRIRIYGFHSEDTPNDKLPLALVMNGGAARLVEKQWVVGFFLDGALAQQPLVLGTVGSAIGNSAKVNSQANPGPNQNKTKDTVQSLTAAVDAARERLRRAIVSGGDVLRYKKELDDLIEKLKKAEAAEVAKAAKSSQTAGTTVKYPDVFPANGRYPFEYLGVPQTSEVPYSRGATANPQPFTNIVLHDTAGGGSGPDSVKGGHNVRADGNAYGYHFYIDRDGKVFQGAPLNVRTNGVGLASPPYTNNNTINISFINGGPNLGNDPTPAQLKTAALLVQDVGNNFGIPKSNITSHGAVAINEFGQLRKSPNEALTATKHVLKTYVDPPKATIPTSTPPPPIKIGTGP